jgi:glutamate-1-semialdehyde 2,1-aminomutase
VRPTTDLHDKEIRAKTAGSLARYERSQRSLAGGVSSGLRRAARPYPLFFDRGAGSRMWDVDANEYIDYGLAWGPLILGHAPPAVADAIAAQAAKGLTFGAQHELEYLVAERLTAILPCADLVAFANAGTDVVNLALRLARAATGRPKYLKFEGHYHGWGDQALVSYRFGPQLPLGHPEPVGKGQLPHDHVLVAEWNDRAAVEALFAAHGAEISLVACEPLLANSGCIPADPGFLKFLREITTRHGALLLFDEVITGFRVALDGGQGRYGVTPDLATFAKAVGAGTPLSVLAGKREYMDLISRGEVVHAGTLNGNPLVLAAAAAALDQLAVPGFYDRLHALGNRLRSGLESLLRAQGHAVVTTGDGPVFQLAFQSDVPRNYRQTMAANKALYSDFALGLLNHGVLVLPDGRWYISGAHSEADIDATLAAAANAL